MEKKRNEDKFSFCSGNKSELRVFLAKNSSPILVTTKKHRKKKEKEERKERDSAYSKASIQWSTYQGTVLN